MKVVFACPSLHRPRVKTYDYMPFIKVYVDKSEYEEYKNNDQNDGIELVACPDGVQGNLCRVRNYILDKEFEDGADMVVIVDDDMSALYYWECDQEEKRVNKRRIRTEEIQPLFEKYGEMCRDLGFYYMGLNCNQDKLSYRQYSPFSFSSYIGGPVQCFLKGGECRYDERLPLKEDYDMTLQQCQKYRGCLRLNFMCYDVEQAKQAGGCATYRNLEREKEQFEILRRKWGSKIVREDKGNSRKGNKRQFDFNPIIKIPIKGI